jgi:uncharacterized coiled-coil DUF342 family protein
LVDRATSAEYERDELRAKNQKQAEEIKVLRGLYENAADSYNREKNTREATDAALQRLIAKYGLYQEGE